MPKSPFEIVGGTYKNPERKGEGLKADEPVREVTPEMLLKLCDIVKAQQPDDLETTINLVKVEEFKEIVHSWEVLDLYEALSRPGMWEPPELTVAVLGEFSERKKIKDYSPRN